MRLITDSELKSRTDAELAVLFQMVSNALAETIPGTPERRKAIESLQNINRVRSIRHRQNRKPGF